MRLKAHQRFGHLLNESSSDETEKFFKCFIDVHPIDVQGFKSAGEIGEVMVSFVVEDPVIQMEIKMT